MKIRGISTGICLSIGVLFNIAHNAQAASFISNVSQSNDPKADIWLNSITQNQVTFSDFILVKTAQVLENTPIILTGKPGETANPDQGGYVNNSGAASTERGDNASLPQGLEVSGLVNPTGLDIATYLGNRNLNNLIDTEDDGSFKINLFFEDVITADHTGLDNLFFWERGQNSDLNIQAIDSTGNLIGTALKLSRNQQGDAGFSINTTEIHEIQTVGTWGVSLSQLGVQSAAGIRVIANSSNSGPDFKVLARKSDSVKSVPEPSMMLGLGLISTILLVTRRRVPKY